MLAIMLDINSVVIQKDVTTNGDNDFISNEHNYYANIEMRKKLFTVLS